MVKTTFSKQHCFQSNLNETSENIVRASFVQSKMIGKSSRSCIEDDFNKDCLLKANEILSPPKKKNIFKRIDLSANTVARIITD